MVEGVDPIAEPQPGGESVKRASFARSLGSWCGAPSWAARVPRAWRARRRARLGCRMDARRVTRSVSVGSAFLFVRALTRPAAT